MKWEHTKLADEVGTIIIKQNSPGMSGSWHTLGGFGYDYWNLVCKALLILRNKEHLVGRIEFFTEPLDNAKIEYPHFSEHDAKRVEELAMYLITKIEWDSTSQGQKFWGAVYNALIWIVTNNKPPG